MRAKFIFFFDYNYMMRKFVIFKNGQQHKFLSLIKSKSFFMWKEIADYLAVSKGMVCFYLHEKSKLPEESFLKLCKKANFDPSKFKVQTIEIADKGEAIVPSQFTSKLAEFIGIMLGDGHLSNIKYQIVVTCGNIDYYYITQYVPKLISSLFSKQPSIRRIKSMKGRAIQCRMYSKRVFDFLIESCGLLPGKKFTPIIPSWIFQNRAFLRSCVRGLVDTDGGLHKHHKYSAQLEFNTKTPSLFNSIKLAFEKLGFKYSSSTKGNTLSVYLFNEGVKRYFKEIGSKNPKNNIKFQCWLNKGILPTNEEIKMKCSGRDSNPDWYRGRVPVLRLLSYH